MKMNANVHEIINDKSKHTFDVKCKKVKFNQSCDHPAYMYINSRNTYKSVENYYLFKIRRKVRENYYFMLEGTTLYRIGTSFKLYIKF